MALKYGFFNAVEQSDGSYDREYDAAFFTHFLNDYFCSAIPAGCFEVSKGNGLTLNISSGHGIVNGVYFYDDSATTFTCAAATGTRNDLLVARLNATARTVELVVKQGTTSADDNEVAIANITVTDSAVTAVSNISYTQIFRYASGTTSNTGTSSDSGNSSSGGTSSDSGNSSSDGTSSESTTKTSNGVLTNKVTSTVSSPTVNYSAKYTATKSSSALSVKLTFAAWLNSSGSTLGTGIKLTVYARINGGAWQSVVIKNTSASWSGTSEHTASLTLSANTAASTATVEFYVTRSGSTFNGTAGNLGSSSSPKSYTIKAA